MLQFDGKGSNTAGVARSENAISTNHIDQSMLSVFQQSWWVEIARGAARYREAQVFENGILIGSLPYVIRRGKLGVRWGASPDWSHLGGPVVSQSLSDEKKSDVLRQLMAQLPRTISFGFTCGPHSDDVHLIRQAFKNAGFVHSTEATYSQSPEEANVLGRMTRKHRLHIKAASRALDIVEIPEDEFIVFYSLNLKESAIESHGSLNVARDLIAKGRNGDTPQVRVTAAKRKKPGVPHDAAIACAWDKRRYYLWMSTRRRHASNSPHDKPHPDAIKLLIVNAMEHAQSLGRIFDADGFNTPGVKALYTQILGIPNEEFRDVFLRLTRIARWSKVFSALYRRPKTVSPRGHT